ncbi:MAG: GyrI-like domain-containing protein [Bacteroidia bacterium]|nr:GyrI-like domain-containing protein [Bacteroidia bacterium]
MKTKIKELKPKKVIFLSSTGAYDGEQTDRTWEQMIQFIKKNKLFHWRMEMIGIGHDNPNITESANCRYDACITVGKKPFTVEGEIGVKEIEGGKYAIFRYRGPYTGLSGIYHAIYHDWLPTSNCKTRNVPVFEKYCNNPNKTKPARLLTEIYIPVE